LFDRILDPGFIGVLIPVVALMIPIVAILTGHQRRMAELIHGGAQNQAAAGEIAALRGEIAELRQLVHQQALAMDSITDLARSQTDLGARFGTQSQG